MNSAPINSSNITLCIKYVLFCSSLITLSLSCKRHEAVDITSAEGTVPQRGWRLTRAKCPCANGQLLCARYQRLLQKNRFAIWTQYKALVLLYSPNVC